MSPRSDDPLDELQTLWQSQPQSEPTLELAALDRGSRGFTRALRRRNRAEWVASVCVVVGLGATVALTSQPLMRLGSVLAVAGVALIAAVLAWRGRPLEPDLAAPAIDHLRLLRENLRRQRNLLRWVPVWYLAPLIPGVVLINLGILSEMPRRGGVMLHSSKVISVLSILFQAALLLLIAWANWRAARKLDERLQILDPAIRSGTGANS